MVDDSITHAIIGSAQVGDMRRLDSYAKQYPQVFAESCATGLLEVAYDAKQPETVLYLILKHHCVVDPSRLAEQDLELLEERPAQLGRTLEVLADAARGHISSNLDYETRGICCYDVVNAVQRAGENIMRLDALSPRMLQSAANGDLRGFIDFVRGEERRGGFTLGRHSGTMLRNVEQHLDAIATYAPSERPAQNESRTR